MISLLAVAILMGAGWVGLGELDQALDPAVFLLAGLGAASVVFPLRFHHDGDVQGFNLTSAVFLSIVMLIDGAVALLVVTVMVTAGYAVATRSLVKVLFNTVQGVIAAAAAIGAGFLVLGHGLGGDVLAPRTLLALAAAALVFGIVSALLVSEHIHRLGGSTRGQLLREILGPALWVTVGDYFIAILLTILADRSPLAVVLAVPMFVGLLLGYRGFAADREAGRQAQLLHGTSRQLLDGALDDAALEDAVAGLRGLFGAERAILAAGDNDGPEWLRPLLAEVQRSGEAVMRSGDMAVLAAPVRLEGRVAGALAVSGRRGLSSWGPSDLDLLSTVAGEIAATLRTRRLLAQIERDRARLAAETSKLTDVLASASDGIVVLDADGRVEACNPAMTAVLGVEQVTKGLPWRDVLHFQDEDGRSLATVTAHPLARALAGDVRVEGSTAALRRPDGEIRWLRCSVAPILSDGEPDGVVLVAVDLTREREVEQLRSDFIATVSHELRTPLTPLSGFLGVMREHGGALDDDRRAMMVESMEKQVGRLSDLISDLLEVAEIERGLTHVRREVVDVPTSVDAVLASEVTPAEEDRVHADLAPVRVIGDQTAVRRIIRALVSNGLKHTSGPVTVVTRREQGQGVLCVIDEGPGIPETSREVIFEPFRRLGNHLHRTQGPGLGLSVARSLAEALEGSLEVDDGPRGRGSEFVLRLPAAARDSGPVDRVDDAV